MVYVNLILSLYILDMSRSKTPTSEVTSPQAADKLLFDYSSEIARRIKNDILPSPSFGNNELIDAAPYPPSAFNQTGVEVDISRLNMKITFRYLFEEEFPAHKAVDSFVAELQQHAGGRLIVTQGEHNAPIVTGQKYVMNAALNEMLRVRHKTGIEAVGQTEGWQDILDAASRRDVAKEQGNTR